MKRLLLLVFCLVMALAVYYFFPEKVLPANASISKLIVYKSQRKMLAYSGESLLKTYPISLGKSPVGAKQFQGDNKTPEGSYIIFDKNPNSICYKNLGISYPSIADKKLAASIGKPTGGDIKIHGLKNGQGFIGKFHRLKDWTNGCIAVTNNEMEELYQHCLVGIPIIIYP